MTLKEALPITIKTLTKSKNASPKLDAEVLLCFILKKPREYLYANPEKTLPKKVISAYMRLLERRAKGLPVAYLTGEKEFFGLKFKVNRHVLIPRPETEGLVELVLEKIKDLRQRWIRLRRKKSKIKILDIGTGSGCIIISLARAIYNLQPITYNLKLFASDISKNALKVAQQNARRHSVKIIFKHGSLLKPWSHQSFDIIIANLPYLAKLEHPSTKFEPRQALVAKKNGLTLIEELFRQLSLLLSPLPLTLFLEFDPRQTAQIKKLARRSFSEGGLAYNLKIYKDLSGRNRFAVISMVIP